MYKLIGSILFCLAAFVASASAQRDYCFKNDGLKVTQTISYTLTKNKLEGTMESGGYDTNTSAETFEFTGTKGGSILTIKFQGKPPYELAPGTKKVVWTLTTRSLKVPMYGKNYKTGKYSSYVATFAKCKGDI